MLFILSSCCFNSSLKKETLMITPFGKELRKIRIDRCLSLRDMAAALGITPAYLSAIETGKRPIPEKLFNAILDYLNADANTQAALEQAKALSAQSITVSLDAANDAAKETMLAFARNFSKLSDNEVAKIRRILASKEIS